MGNAASNDNRSGGQRSRPEEDESAVTLPCKQPASDGKVYFSYADVHATVNALVPRLKKANFEPTVMIAIGGGGFIPARILRTILKKPILAVSLELYDDATNSMAEDGKVKRLQWFDDTHWPGNLVPNGNVLIIDEVDDTRTTLQYCVEEVMKHKPAKLAVAVVHNKLKPKRGALPKNVEYFAGANVMDHWNCYPWDASAYGRDIHEHEALAKECMPKIKK